MLMNTSSRRMNWRKEGRLDLPTVPARVECVLIFCFSSTLFCAFHIFRMRLCNFDHQKNKLLMSPLTVSYLVYILKKEGNQKGGCGRGRYSGRVGSCRTVRLACLPLLCDRTPWKIRTPRRLRDKHQTRGLHRLLFNSSFPGLLEDLYVMPRDLALSILSHIVKHL